MEIISQRRGCLYVVATPIGNLRDLSGRAVETFKTVELILCEDTRVTRRLLQHYGIAKPLRSLHAHNEHRRHHQLIAQLCQGHSMALVSDAGVPTIHDPGRLLIAAARQAGIQIVPIPGASAVLAALSCSGFDAERFVFEGFLPSRHLQRMQRLNVLANETRTLVFYEAPHRACAMLRDLRSVFGDERLLCLAKELTKVHESFITGSATEVLAWLQQDKRHQKGEFTVLLANCSAEQAQHERLAISESDLFQAVLHYLPARKAATLTARLSGGSANRLYRQAVQQKSAKI